MSSLAPSIAPTPARSASTLHKRARLAFLLLRVIACLLAVSCTAHFSFAQGGQPSEEKEAASPAPTSTGKITGRIVTDDGKPLPDVAIYIFKIYARTPGAPQVVQTDVEGKFQSDMLSSGLYSINANLPGFTLAQRDLNENGEPRYYRPGDSVSLTMVKGGVITGTVRDNAGEPVVGVLVRAMRVRDANGKRSNWQMGFGRDRMTDDRGIYRLYGLEPGAYIVSAGGSSRFFGIAYAYSGDVVTYFPSSTRDTAAEVTVHQGEEVTGIDIRYRGERGRVVSGTISGTSDASLRIGISVILRQVGSAGIVDQTFVQPSGKPAFSFEGVADGEYELVAQQGMGAGGEQIASATRRVSIKGADVTGLELALMPLASIAGRVTLEPAPKEPCAEERGAALLETAITARRDEKSKAVSPSLFFSMSMAIPDEQGDYLLRNLTTGNYRLGVRLPNDHWYARSIALPAAAPAVRASADAGATSQTKSASTAPSYVIALKSGERVTGANIQIAQDGATIRGRVSSSVENSSVPDDLKVYLIPQERERAEDTLRYSETAVTDDGTFTMRNIAPGRYLIYARVVVADNESADQTPRPIFWDAAERAKLRREAEALSNQLELKPCQRIADYGLRYPLTK